MINKFLFSLIIMSSLWHSSMKKEKIFNNERLTYAWHRGYDPIKYYYSFPEAFLFF